MGIELSAAVHFDEGEVLVVASVLELDFMRKDSLKTTSLISSRRRCSLAMILVVILLIEGTSLASRDLARPKESKCPARPSEHQPLPRASNLVPNSTPCLQSSSEKTTISSQNDPSRLK